MRLPVGMNAVDVKAKNVKIFLLSAIQSSKEAIPHVHCIVRQRDLDIFWIVCSCVCVLAVGG